MNPYAKAGLDEPPAIVVNGVQYVPFATYDRVIKAFQWKLEQQNQKLAELAKP